jgi:hypothetical protein
VTGRRSRSETAAVWDPLIDELDGAGVNRSSLIRLSPPGLPP